MSKVPAAVVEAQAALDAARARHAEAVQEEKAAMAAVAAAQGALIEARTMADDGLPRAEMLLTIFGKTTRCNVVIVRRAAKTITVRRPGEPEEYSFRIGWGDVWREYPAKNGYSSTQRTLEIDA